MDFSDQMQKAQFKKMYKFNFIKIKNVCSLKDSYKNKKAKHRLEKIFATHISIKDFYLRNFATQ